MKGRNVEENQYIKMGAYHTIDLELNRKFTIFKEHWDSVTLERVETACDPAAVSDLPDPVAQSCTHALLKSSSFILIIYISKPFQSIVVPPFSHSAVHSLHCYIHTKPLITIAHPDS